MEGHHRTAEPSAARQALHVDLGEIAWDVREALIQVLDQNWIGLECDPADIEHAALQLGWTPAAIRAGGGPRALLRPTTPETAHPRSLSAQYGLGEQPLHTDGAHLQVAPDVVVLHCVGASDTATVLLAPDWHPDIVVEDDWRQGVFMTRSGADRWLSTALGPRGYRLDPGCMSPLDSIAKRVLQQAHGARSAAMRFAWSRPGLTLLINNRRTLHARNAVHTDLGRRMVRLAYTMAGGQK